MEKGAGLTLAPGLADGVRVALTFKTVTIAGGSCVRLRPQFSEFTSWNSRGAWREFLLGAAGRGCSAIC